MMKVARALFADHATQLISSQGSSEVLDLLTRLSLSLQEKIDREWMKIVIWACLKMNWAKLHQKILRSCRLEMAILQIWIVLQMLKNKSRCWVRESWNQISTLTPRISLLLLTEWLKRLKQTNILRLSPTITLLQAQSYQHTSKPPSVMPWTRWCSVLRLLRAHQRAEF